MATIVGQRSPLFYKKVAGGLPVILDTSKFTGNVFYVDSAVGTDGAGYGSTPDAPLATIDYAIGLCTASQGDVILVLPGHAEDVAAAITCDIAGVKIIGLGESNDRPALTGADVLDAITVTADDVTIENLRFPTPSAAVTALINVAAANCKVRKCVFELGANIVDAVTITAAGELPTFEDCEVIVSADGPDSWLKIEGVIDRLIVKCCKVIGSDGSDAFDDGVFDFNSQAATNPMIYDNDFNGADVATTVFANVASVVGDAFGPNRYSGSATDGDTVTNAVATIADGGLTAAKFAASSIAAASLATDTLQAIQDEAEDALEGEKLNHLMALDGATQKYPEQAAADSTIAKMIAKGDPATPSSYDCTTDSQEALSDKLGGFSGDGGADQDDSVKASLDLAHTDLDDIITALTTIDNFLDTEVAAILADTGTDGVVIADGAITATKFGANAIDATAIAAGAIDAATLAGDCITNAKIADDAIAAENIATGALTADAFAADAIVAATLATGALTADAFAANAVVAATLASDCITNAKIADDAIAAENIATGALTSDAFAASAGEYTTDGIVVTRATAALPQTTAAALFTVTGHCLLKRILGVVTVQVGAVGNVAHLQLNSTGAGATTDLCLAGGGLDITGDVVDTTYEITGTFGDAMVATTNLPKAPSQAADILLVPGSLELDCAGSDGGTGRVRWSVTYVPLESGASIAAA